MPNLTVQCEVEIAIILHEIHLCMSMLAFGKSTFQVTSKEKQPEQQCLNSYCGFICDTIFSCIFLIEVE